MSLQRKSLGRGLGAIISAGAKKAAESGAKKVASTADAPMRDVRISSHGLFSEISVDKIIPSPFQARKEFCDDDISQLADSIASEGLLQPLLVRQCKDGYELLAGERRLRACRKLGMKKVVACVQTASDASSAAKGLIENLQRSDLNPIEEALGILNMMENFHLTQDAVSQRLGKPRSSVANSLRLLKLPDEIRGYIAKGLISLGHAKVILGVDDPVQQTIIARRIIENGLNVRNTEEALKRLKNSADRNVSGTRESAAAQGAVLADLQRRLASRLNAKVEVRSAGRRGKIVIPYADNDDLQRIIEMLGVKI